MATSSDLTWRFIKTLSSSEKIFFKRNFSNGQPGSQRLYLQLFDAIAAQKKYDEAAILKKFSPSLNKKNIASQKHYLHRQVCDAVIMYEGQRNAGHDIYKQLQLIRMYRKKGLVEEAHTIWKKAVLKARASESYALLNLLKTEFEKMVLFSSLHSKYDELHSIFKSNFITYTQYAEMITLRDVYTEILLLKRRAHYDMGEELKKKVSELLGLVNECSAHTNSKSFWYGHYYRMSKASLLYLMNDFNTSLELFSDILRDWKKNSHFIITHGEYYIELMYMINYAGVLHGSYKYVSDVFNDPLNDLIAEPVQRANFEAIKYLALNKIYNKTARYNEVKKLVTAMKLHYPGWEPMLNADMNRTANLSLAIASFVLEQFDDAHYYARRALTYFRDGVREEHTPVAQILLLLITYGLNNARLFDAQYRSTYNYFYKRKKQHPFETALVQCLHRSFYLTDSQSKIKEYQKALDVFDRHKDDIVQQMAFTIFNYPAWLVSKVQRISYRQFVERKVRQGSKLKDPTFIFNDPDFIA
ncbi:MAG TPA: hypothetical protein VMZ03_01440 [Chitinophagaceae bacterium]|nr:hypothetical protein [Chitinophagaceae bacterium]